MKRTLLTLVALLCLTTCVAPAAAQNTDRLEAQLDALENRLQKTRKLVKRQAVRLARLERQRDVQAPGLASPDGRFAIGLTNEGLQLRGPGPGVTVGAGSLTLSSGAGGSLLQLAGPRATLRAPQISLGGGSNCPPVARLGDGVQVQASGGVMPGSIIGSSTGVFAC